MEYRYNAEKFCGRVYCGNGFFDTVDECVNFMNDGFCDKVKVINMETQEKLIIKLRRSEC